MYYPSPPVTASFFGQNTPKIAVLKHYDSIL
jgi:hypothetical protein